jgi:hypothetical protein
MLLNSSPFYCVQVSFPLLSEENLVENVIYHRLYLVESDTVCCCSKLK